MAKGKPVFEKDYGKGNILNGFIKGSHFSYLKDSEYLLENVLFSEQLLPVPTTGGFDLQGVLPVLLVLLVGQKVDDVLKQTRQRSAKERLVQFFVQMGFHSLSLSLSDDAFLQFGRHCLENLKGIFPTRLLIICLPCTRRWRSPDL